MDDKLTEWFAIRIEPWLKDVIRSWPREKRHNVIEAVRKLLEHEAKETYPKHAGQDSGQAA